MEIELPLDWTEKEKTTWREIASQAMECSKHGKKIVLVTGVFDLLHEEHKKFLYKAKAAGDCLVVGVESDVRVRRLKGPDRPKISQLARVEAIRELGITNHIAVLPEHFDAPKHYEAFIALILPHYLAVSSHSPHQERKQKILLRYGGKLLIVHEHNPQVSTTKILTGKLQ